MIDESDDLDGLARCAGAGDEAAFGALLGRVRGTVFRWALARLGDVDDAEDVTQDVSLALHRRLSAFEARSRFTSWLFTITRNAAVELERRRRSRSGILAEAGPDAIGIGTVTTAERLERFDDRRLAELVRVYLAELPQRQREVFELVDLQGWQPAEAAERLGLEAVTARTHLLRARRAIRGRIMESFPALAEDR